MILLADNPTDAFSSLSLPHTLVAEHTHDAPRLKFLGQREVFILTIKPTPGCDIGDGAHLELRPLKGELDPFRSFVGAFEKTHERTVALAKVQMSPEDDPNLRK